ncbi:hypothetical protein ACFLTW_05755 [Chloroflexota bacterium]
MLIFSEGLAIKASPRGVWRVMQNNLSLLLELIKEIPAYRELEDELIKGGGPVPVVLPGAAAGYFTAGFHPLKYPG